MALLRSFISDFLSKLLNAFPGESNMFKEIKSFNIKFKKLPIFSIDINLF